MSHINKANLILSRASNLVLPHDSEDPERDVRSLRYKINQWVLSGTMPKSIVAAAEDMLRRKLQSMDRK